MIKHSIIAALVVLLVASLVFAQPVGTVTYGSGTITPTSNGVIVTNEEVTVPMEQQVQTAKQKTAMHQHQVQHQAAAQRAAASAAATKAANEASLKKGEPKLKVHKTTTTTGTYDVSITNKRGTTDYGIAEESVTNAQGQTQTEGVVYSSYSPSKAARANAKGMEISLAGGATLLYNKDSRGDRYSKIGMGADVSMLKDVCTHLALGLDYMMLHPGSKTYDGRHYHGIYAHNISLAGKFTLNPWDNFQVYLPMGFGMMNARMKTVTDGETAGDNKWGASMYAGLGVQYDFTASLFAGLEYRYAYGWISDKNLTPFHKDKNVQFHNMMLRVGMRF